MNTMHVLFWSLTAWATCVELQPPKDHAWAVEAGPSIDVEVDASELPQQALRVRMRIPTAPPKLSLICSPGVDGIGLIPEALSGSASIEIVDSNGCAVGWTGNSLHTLRLDAALPEGADHAIVNIIRRTPRPNGGATARPAYESSRAAFIRWDECLLIPEGRCQDEVRVRVRVKLPVDWRHASALTTQGEVDGWIEFAEVSWRQLLERPLICGRHLVFYPLTGGEPASVTVHAVGETFELAESLARISAHQHRHLLSEASAVLGDMRADEHQFLIVCANHLQPAELATPASSLMIAHERQLRIIGWRRGWGAQLLPRMYVRAALAGRPATADVWAGNNRVPGATDTAWLLDGLTEYLGWLLSVRGSVLEWELYTAELALLVHELEIRQEASERGGSGRDFLRDRSPTVSYPSARDTAEAISRKTGMLCWLWADAIIRRKTEGSRSLDDFCQQFFAREGRLDQALPVTLHDITDHLGRLADHDWAGLFAHAVRGEEFGHEQFLAELGYQLAWSPEVNDHTIGWEFRDSSLIETASMGVVIDQDGRVSQIVPDSAAHVARLERGMTMTGVNGRRYSHGRLREAIAASDTTGGIDLIVRQDDRYRNIRIEYAEGARYPCLRRADDTPDVLADIVEPTATRRD